jgi:hypothetical protein
MAQIDTNNLLMNLASIESKLTVILTEVKNTYEFFAVLILVLYCLLLYSKVFPIVCLNSFAIPVYI